MASELFAARSYLFTRLSEALSIEVYPLNEAPPDAVMPYVLFDAIAEPDEQSKTRTERASLEAVVRVMAEGPLGPLVEHLEAIEEALDFRSGVVGGFMVTSRRKALFGLPVDFEAGSNTPVREEGLRVQLKLTRVEEEVEVSP